MNFKLQPIFYKKIPNLICYRYLREPHDLGEQRNLRIHQLCEAESLHQLASTSVGEILAQVCLRIKDGQGEVQAEEIQEFPNMKIKKKTSTSISSKTVL